MDSWKKVWRDGLSPLLSMLSLQCLRKALIDGGTRLIQGATPPLQDWPVEAGCVTAFCGWAEEYVQYPDADTVGEAEEFFARMCFEIDQRLGELAACRWFLNFFDETPRNEMRRLLLKEVDLVLEQRGAEFYLNERSNQHE